MVKTNVISQSLPGQAGSATNDIHPIKAPVVVPNVWIWVWVAIILAALALLAWWFWRKRKRQPALEPPAPAIPPHERAFSRLREALSLLDQPRPFCILVSDTVRVYIEERFHLRAPERTTEEFLEELQSSPLLTYEQKRTLGEFLAGCDLVKFARYEPARSELQTIYDSAVRFVEETQAPPSLPLAAETSLPAGQSG